MAEQNGPVQATLSRRQSLKLMGAGASMAMLVACAAPTAPMGSAAIEGGAPPAQAPTAMTVAHRKEYFPAIETAFTDAVGAWATENNVDVDTTVVAAEATEDFVPTILAALDAGTPPDFIYHTRLTQQLYFHKALQAVSDTVEEAIAAYGQPTVSHVRHHRIEGQWWAIPYLNSGGGHFARRSFFAAIGVNPLRDLTTYDDLRVACLEVSNPPQQLYGWGRTVNSSGDGQETISDILLNWGSRLTDANMSELTFLAPETVAAVEWLAAIYRDPKYAPMIPPDILTWRDADNNQAYLNGTIAYTTNAASLYAKAKADGNPVFADTVVLPPPVGPSKQTLSSGGQGQICIPTGARAVDLAKRLALHLLNPDIFLPMMLLSAGLFLPAYAAYAEMGPVVKALNDDENLKRMSAQRQGDFAGIADPADPHPYFEALQSQAVFSTMLLEVITNGVTPAHAVAKATARMQQIAEAMGLQLS